MPQRVADGILRLLHDQLGSSVVLNGFTLSSGGCINHGGVLQTSQRDFFVKWNDSRPYPNMFEAEAKGLNALTAANCFRVPQVIGVGEVDTYQFIVLESIDKRKKKKSFWSGFGHQVASLHRHSAAQYGLDYDNYIGSLRQSNHQSTSWLDFFVEQRLTSQLMLAEREGLVDHELQQKFAALFKKLPSLIPKHPPSLLHGDLWSGNVLSDDDGAPCVIDPAIYFGAAEMELSYTKLFGGFDPAFYRAYHEVIPRESQFEERMEIYNLYPLLVHLNLFGGHYRQEVETSLDRFV